MERNFYMSRRGVADYLCISARTVDRWRKAGLIKGVRMGNRRRYSLREIERFMRRLQEGESDA